jgi:CRISPR-associated endoribonuclease Cas6
MRIRLNLKQKKDNQIIPINYQYNISSFIYRTMEKSDSFYSQWLHDNGYANGSKKFKFFTFSFLNIPEREINNNTLIVKSPYISLIVSLPFDESAMHFITGLFSEQTLKIYNEQYQAEFLVKTVEALPDPKFTSQMKFRARTPLILKSPNTDKHTFTYIGPDHILFPILLKRNLHEKYITKCLTFNKTVQSEGIEEVKAFGDFKPKLITIRENRKEETKVKGYLCSFEITGNPEVIKVGYEAGFGCNNSLGFGFAEVIS